MLYKACYDIKSDKVNIKGIVGVQKSFILVLKVVLRDKKRKVCVFYDDTLTGDKKANL